MNGACREGEGGGVENALHEKRELSKRGVSTAGHQRERVTFVHLELEGLVVVEEDPLFVHWPHHHNQMLTQRLQSQTAIQIMTTITLNNDDDDDNAVAASENYNDHDDNHKNADKS